jgi:hypothetical protein
VERYEDISPEIDLADLQPICSASSTMIPSGPRT